MFLAHLTSTLELCILGKGIGGSNLELVSGLVSIDLLIESITSVKLLPAGFNDGLPLPGMLNGAKGLPLLISLFDFIDRIPKFVAIRALTEKLLATVYLTLAALFLLNLSDKSSSPFKCGGSSS